MKKRFLKRIFGFGIATAIAASPYLIQLTNQTKEIDLTYQQTYSQMLESRTYEYRPYLFKVKPLIQEIEIELKKIRNGDGKDIPTEKQRQEMYKNMVSGYEGSKTSVSRFKQPLDYLDNLTFNAWKAFPDYDTNYTIIDRYKDMLNTFEILHDEFGKTLVDFKIRSMQHKDLKTSGLTKKEQSILGAQIVINQKTLTNSYKLIEWYKLILLEKIEFWKVHNPADSTATKKEYKQFLEKLNNLNFNLLKQK